VAAAKIKKVPSVCFWYKRTKENLNFIRAKPTKQNKFSLFLND